LLKRAEAFQNEFFSRATPVSVSVLRHTETETGYCTDGRFSETGVETGLKRATETGVKLDFGSSDIDYRLAEWS
jgi:hypothetical protein